MVYAGAEGLCVLRWKEMFHRSVNCIDSIFFWHQNSELPLKLQRLYGSHFVISKQVPSVWAEQILCGGLAGSVG